MALRSHLADELAGVVDDPRVQRSPPNPWPYSYPPPKPPVAPPPLGEYLADKLEPYVDQAGLGGQLARLARYQIAPERTLKPNERLLRGVKEGGDYELREGETTDDAGNVFDAQGNKLSFQNPPALRQFADLIGDAMGPGIPKGPNTLASGLRWPVRGELPSEAARTATGFPEALAATMRRNKGGGYPAVEIPPGTRSLTEKNKLLDAGLEKADKALTTVSSLTPNDLARAERAQGMGFHTPVYHATEPTISKYASKDPTPEQLQLIERGAPFTEMDPFLGRGALYTADKPSVAMKGAQIDPYQARIYGGVVGGPIYGETPMSAGLTRELPPQLSLAKDSNIADIMHGISKNPAYAPNMDAAMREKALYRERGGEDFDREIFLKTQDKARKDLAQRIMDTYYDRDSRLLIPPGQFKPLPSIPNFNARIPPYGQFEAGRHSNVWAPGLEEMLPRSGVHSTMQTAMGNAGFSGSRVADETAEYGKTIAMVDPAMVRWGGAAFRDPNGDLLSGRVPPAWLLPPREDERRQVP